MRAVFLEPPQAYLDERRRRGEDRWELVVEIRSPGDETYDKLDFYAATGVREVLVVHPVERRIEVFRAVGDIGRLLPVQPAADGMLGADTLGVEFRTRDGVLHLTWDGGSAEI